MHPPISPREHNARTDKQPNPIGPYAKTSLMSQSSTSRDAALSEGECLTSSQSPYVVSSIHATMSKGEDKNSSEQTSCTYLSGLVA